MITLPSLARLDQTSPRIWLAAAPADMRCGFDRLARMASEVTGQDPFSGHFFIFRSKSSDRVKILYWDRDGYALWYKRLEKGTFRSPRLEAGAVSIELKASELAMMLDGIDLRSLRRVERYTR